jgi:O-antigen/teichoic acid export membrane protein
MATGGLAIFLFNIDKLAIWLLMGKENLGIYALQSHFTKTVLILPAVVAAVVYPRIMESYGKEQTIEGLKRYLTRPTLIMGYLGCPVLGILCLTIHLPIQWLLLL